MTLRAQEKITSIDKWDCMELNSFDPVEEAIGSRDKHKGFENIFANCTWDIYLEYITKEKI